jgi:predicted Zn-dependent protease
MGYFRPVDHRRMLRMIDTTISNDTQVTLKAMAPSGTLSIFFRHRGTAVAAALLFGAQLLLGSCADNSAGGSMFSLMSAQDEQKVGDVEHPKLVQEFGGEIEDPALKRYVDSVGNLLVKTTEMSNAKFTFSVLDDNIVNAFALPGGYVHITRGLMALANNEAELAGVMGHEIGHVTAHHSAQLYTRSVLTQILATGIGIATGVSQLGEVASQGAGVYLKSYSRENEYEADSLGVRYLTRAGYDPQAMADFLASLEAHSRLEAELAGKSADSADQFDIMATHPRTVDRVQKAIAEAGEAGKPKGPTDDGRDVYLRQINGLIYGDSPRQGYVRGTRFAHPIMKFEFRVPDGFRLSNQPTAVVANHPNGATIAFDEIPKSGGISPRSYLSRINVALTGIEDIDLNGLQAATGAAQIRGSNGVRDVRIVAVRFSPDHLFRFIFLTPPQFTASLADGLKRTTYSFRGLSTAEAAALKPLRIRVVRTHPGDTVTSMAARMAFTDHQEQRFRVLNGLAPNDGLPVAGLVKIVVDTDVPKEIF